MSEKVENESAGTGDRKTRQAHFVAPEEVAAPGETDAVHIDQPPTSMWSDAWRDLRSARCSWSHR